MACGHPVSDAARRWAMPEWGREREGMVPRRERGRSTPPPAGSPRHLAVGLSLQAVPVLAPVLLPESGVALQRLGLVASTAAARTTLVLLAALPYSGSGGRARTPATGLARKGSTWRTHSRCCTVETAFRSWRGSPVRWRPRRSRARLLAVSYVVEGLGKSLGQAGRAPIRIVALQPASQPAREAVGENGISL
jgi:hypothetical protein